jgi:hypothetical protein
MGEINLERGPAHLRSLLMGDGIHHSLLFAHQAFHVGKIIGSVIYFNQSKEQESKKRHAPRTRPPGLRPYWRFGQISQIQLLRRLL